ncbi:MAG: hypothetical protein QNK37_12800 [Acidobacteriota bacterium]|nr:hypothetical protein [Acidobacteriota bacterium]
MVPGIFPAVFFLCLSHQIIIEDTEIYDILDANTIAIDAVGDFYLVDRRSCQVKVYSRDGGLRRVIGGRGEGPGELAFVHAVRYRDGEIYVFDPMRANVQIFAGDGAWRRTLKIDRNIMMSFPYLTVVSTGWVYADPGKGSVHWVDHDFQNMKVLARVNRSDHPPNTIVPAKEMACFVYHPEKEALYLTAGGPFRIDIYDLQPARFREPIVKKVPRKPLNKDFAQERYEYLLSVRDPRGRKNLKPHYPDLLPAIAMIQLDPDGLLVVWPGSYLQYKKTPPMVFDTGGNPQISRWPLRHLMRIMVVEGDDVYVSAYKDGEFCVARVAVDQVASFFEQNPVQN